ncbi:hypothetical protein Y032_1138g3674 [Ancylostoma ceylanicum]|uniref:Uncharacterized protein n=1 Tax=Ancylostoma ceylanicum TaxID=53326 RepID=A0A016W825_9BILA|nr:hypothetical protein Y032_1138g3674 [Ancylostoma ceylanicum]
MLRQPLQRISARTVPCLRPYHPRWRGALRLPEECSTSYGRLHFRCVLIVGGPISATDRPLYSLRSIPAASDGHCCTLARFECLNRLSIKPIHQETHIWWKVKPVIISYVYCITRFIEEFQINYNPVIRRKGCLRM